MSGISFCVIRQIAYSNFKLIFKAVNVCNLFLCNGIIPTRMIYIIHPFWFVAHTLAHTVSLCA